MGGIVLAGAGGGCLGVVLRPGVAVFGHGVLMAGSGELAAVIAFSIQPFGQIFDLLLGGFVGEISLAEGTLPVRHITNSFASCVYRLACLFYSVGASLFFPLGVEGDIGGHGNLSGIVIVVASAVSLCVPALEVEAGAGERIRRQGKGNAGMDFHCLHGAFAAVGLEGNGCRNIPLTHRLGVDGFSLCLLRCIDYTGRTAGGIEVEGKGFNRISGCVCGFIGRAAYHRLQHTVFVKILGIELVDGSTGMCPCIIVQRICFVTVACQAQLPGKYIILAGCVACDTVHNDGTAAAGLHNAAKIATGFHIQNTIARNH